MKFSRWVFRVAGVYGITVLAPLYFMESRIGHDQPPAITHPEFYYGFIGLALGFQLLFFIISRDPARFRPVMPVCILEKVIYTGAVIALYLQHRVYPVTLYWSLIDPLFGVLFLVAYLKLPTQG